MGCSERSRCALEALEGRRLLSGGGRDYVYIGDSLDDSVERFDAETGEHLGTFIAPAAGGLHGPRGMIFRNPSSLLVVNQNVDQPFAGEVLRYDGKTGAVDGAVVPSSNPDAPFAPRGMVLKGNVLYVADVLGAETITGRIAMYSANKGRFLGELVPEGFGQFNPRGVVFGPDGGLYVSAFDVTNPLVGHILRFDVKSGDHRVVATNDGDGVAEPGETQDLHRPEGIVFSPDGRLYITSPRADETDTDKILEFDAASGAQTGDIELDQPGQPRAFAQAMAFGPGGKLFVPISGNGPDTGSVRAYDVGTEEYSVFIQPGGVLGQPWFLTFGKTDAATLAYEGHADAHGQSQAGDDGAANDADGDENEDELLAAEVGGGVLD